MSKNAEKTDTSEKKEGKENKEVKGSKELNPSPLSDPDFLKSTHQVKEQNKIHKRSLLSRFRSWKRTSRDRVKNKIRLEDEEEDQMKLKQESSSVHWSAHTVSLDSLQAKKKYLARNNKQETTAM